MKDESDLCRSGRACQDERITSWRSDAPPPETKPHVAGASGVKGHAHLHPRGMKHKRFTVAGVKVK